MGVFDSKRYKDAYERVIAKSQKLCKVTELRDTPPKESADGRPARSVTWIQFTLLEPAKSTDGEELAVGFYKEVGFGYYDNPAGDDKCDTTNRITEERIRELIVCALGLPATCKTADEELEKQGGPQALVGKIVGVDWAARGNQQNIDKFLSPKIWEEKAKK